MAAEKEDRDMRRAPCVARSPTAYEQAGQKHGRTIPLAATRAAKCFTIISLSLRAPLSASPCRLLVGPHARAIEKHHAELDPTVLNKVQQALPTPARAQRMKSWAVRHQGPSSSGTARHL